MYFKLYIRKRNPISLFSYDYHIEQRTIYVKNKKELFAYIGYLYCNTIEQIDRIDYYKLSDVKESVLNISDFLKQYE